MLVTPDTIDTFVADFIKHLPENGQEAHIVGLSGNLGAGKTTFVQHLAQALGATERVTSPTFVLVQRYAIVHPRFTSLVHIDAYRLEPGDEKTIGWDMYCRDPRALVLVEWPEKLGAAFPSNSLTLRFEVVDEVTRNIAYA